MSYVITMPVYNRPEFLRQVLDSLKHAQGIEKYLLIICMEPRNPEVYKLAREIDFCKVKRVYNQTRGGMRWNTYQCLTLGLKQSDYVIHLEEDVRISPDGLLYFEWARDKYKHNRDVFSITGYCGPQLDAEMPENAYKVRYHERDHYTVKRFPWFTPSGWATWGDRLQEIIKDWEFGKAAHTWGMRVNEVTRRERYQIFPTVARTQNIGHYGENIGKGKALSEQWFWKNVYNDVWAESIELSGKGDWHEPSA